MLCACISWPCEEGGVDAQCSGGLFCCAAPVAAADPWAECPAAFGVRPCGSLGATGTDPICGVVAGPVYLCESLGAFQRSKEFREVDCFGEWSKIPGGAASLAWGMVGDEENSGGVSCHSVICGGEAKT